MERYEVIVAETALRQLGECVLFIAKDNVDAAENLHRRLIEGIRPLSSYPARYPFFNERYIPANRYHKMFIEKCYLVLYQIKDQTVYVDYVLDCRRDYKWLFRE